MISLSDAVLVGAGAILALLGVAVAALQRDRVGFFFASFCAGHGALSANAGVTASMDYATFARGSPLSSSDVVLASAFVLSGVGLLGLALAVPRGLRRAAPAGLLLAALVGGTLAVWANFALATLYARPWITALNALHVGVLVFAYIVFPLRFAAQPPAAAASRRTLALLASGLALNLAGQGGDLIIAARNGQLVWIEVAATAALLLAVPLWLRSAHGPDGRIARNVALLIPAVLLLTMIVPGEGRASFYAPGLVGGALLLGYAVLRGEIQGLDLKVRFAISKSTIAAVFIAVFFIASEAAQQFFGDTLGSTYVGIAAAGMLVFAMAPLQRAAERLAERAVPITDSGPARAAPTEGRAEAYRAALRLAWSDGSISREDEDALDLLADELGLSRREATALRREVDATVVRP